MLKRAERRQRQASDSNNRPLPFGFVRAPLLPDFQAPPRSHSTRVALDSEMAQDFITLPSKPKVVGNTFCLLPGGDDEIYYRVVGFELLPDGKLKFQVQYEDVQYVIKLFVVADADVVVPSSADIVDSDELTRMLEDSELVTSG